MDVRILHNDSDISQYVIQYNREHKICTGIGTIQVEVSPALSGTFTTWDSIKIYENDILVMEYFVSQIVENQPSATILIEAQDNSKRLTDYFIAETYMSDGGYARYWIELFLGMAGVDADFTTDSQGGVLSNNTSLGMVSAYEQIVSLLQYSGWYMTFLSNGKAQIGELNNNADPSDTVDNSEITSMIMTKDDKMLRNKVIVWGTGDPSSNRWVFAEVYRPTKWNYDGLDERTIVIANSNIPNVASAFLLANKALLEFGKITVVKEVELAGLRTAYQGDTVMVSNRIWSGKGLVTTLRVTMSANGLKTTYVLDERCPRLFGYFGPSSRVYIGTYGSGVWRKNVDLYPEQWYNYSNGLTDLCITDLHVNKGALTSISASGQAYTNLEGNNWIPVTITGLYVLYSGVAVAGDENIYSGIMSRACILDRTTNSARIAVDTRSGINYGDFLTETSALATSGYGIGTAVLLSGMMAPDNLRSWILDVSPYDGYIKNTFPIHLSGNYDVAVLDIENDGFTDYVSVAALASGAYSMGYGTHTNYSSAEYYSAELGGTRGFKGTTDPNMLTSFPYDETFEGFGESAYIVPLDYYFCSLFNRMSTEEEAFVVGYRTITSVNKYNVSRFYRDTPTTITSNQYTHNFYAGDTQTEWAAILRDGDGFFEFIRGDNSKLMVVTYDYVGGNVTYSERAYTTSISLTDMNVPFKITLGGDHFSLANTLMPHLVLGDYYYCLYVEEPTMGNFNLKLLKVNLRTGANTITIVKTFSTFPNADSYGYAVQKGIWTTYDLGLFQNGDSDIQLSLLWQQFQNINGVIVEGGYIKRFVQIGEGNSGTESLLHTYTTYSIENLRSKFRPYEDNSEVICKQNFTKERAALAHVIFDTSGGIGDAYWEAFLIDTIGNAFWTDNMDYADIHYNASYIYFTQNTANNADFGLVKTVSGFSFFNLDTLLMENELIISTEYTVDDYLQVVDSYSGDLYFKAHYVNEYAETIYRVISATQNGSVTRNMNFWGTGLSDRNYLCGNFLLEFDIADGEMHVALVDNRTVNVLAPSYFVLKRRDYDYDVLYSGAYQQRLDLSSDTPLVMMDRRIASTQAVNITASGTTIVSNITMSGYGVEGFSDGFSVYTAGLIADDFRYSDFQYFTYGDTAIEGVATRALLVPYNGDMGTIDLNTIAEFRGTYPSSSGYITRVEISNFEMPDQYIFVTISGYSISGYGFYQKNPEGIFIDYSAGMPQARPTIIRLDDSI